MSGDKCAGLDTGQCDKSILLLFPCQKLLCALAKAFDEVNREILAVKLSDFFSYLIRLDDMNMDNCKF